MKKTFLLLLFLPLLSISQDNGDLVFVYQAPKNNNQVASVIYQQKALEPLRQFINENLAFPRNIPVYIRSCGEENAYYSPNENKIVLCYEIIELQFSLLQKNFLKGSNEQEDAITGSAAFILIHELGHALRHQYNLSITGKEENAVDEFSLMMLLDYNNKRYFGINIFYGIIAWYYMGLKEAKAYGPKFFADEHAPSLERYYDLLSRYYGSPVSEPFRELLLGTKAPWQLPPNRAARSGREYQTARESWDNILSKYRNGSQSNSTSSRTATSWQKALEESAEALEIAQAKRDQENQLKREKYVTAAKANGYKRTSMIQSFGDVYFQIDCFSIPSPTLKNRGDEGIIEIAVRIDSTGKVIAQKVIYSDLRRKIEMDCYDLLRLNKLTKTCTQTEEFTDGKILFHFK